MPRVFVLFSCILLPSLAAAHVVTTNDGKTYEGRVTSEDDSAVVIHTTFDGVKIIPRENVKTVNTSVPPLRDQFDFRKKRALNDAKGLYKVYTWAKKKGFSDEEREPILERIIKVDPKHKRARKLLGHEEVDGRWMSPAEKKQYLVEKHRAEMEAKGLVLYKGGWVTPEERDAREKGLKKDGDDWVTEEEFHRRRGEVKVDGKWVKLGMAEGKAFHAKARKGSRVPKLTYKWGPHFDVIYDCSGDDAAQILKSSEKAFGIMRSVLRPQGEDFPEDGSARIVLFLINKLPTFVRVASWFAKEYKVEEIAKGWGKSVRRQHAWWWVQDQMAVSARKFPNVTKTFNSNLVHHLGHTLLTRYKLDYQFPSAWLLKGFSYYLEMKANGYSLTFSLGRGQGTVETGEDTDKPVWAESGKWRRALQGVVTGGQDPPLRRLAKMRGGNFRYVELVKSWSVVDFLIQWDREKFKKFIDTMKTTEAKEEDALKAAYGTGYRGVDQKWRTFVKAGFKVGVPAPEPVAPKK